MVITSPPTPMLPKLPDELWLNVVNKLDINDCCSFSKVSKDFQKIGNDFTYWNRFLKPEYHETSDGNQAKATFFTNLAARNTVGLARDMAGYLYSKIEYLKGYDQTQYQEEIKEEIASLIGMGKAMPGSEIKIEKILLGYQEINSSLDADHILQIGKFRKEAALTIFNREHLLKKLDGSHLLEIATHYEADREIIINILTREELYNKFSLEDVAEIISVYGKEEELSKIVFPEVTITVPILVDMLRKYLIPPVVPNDYKYSMRDIEAVLKRA